MRVAPAAVFVALVALAGCAGPVPGTDLGDSDSNPTATPTEVSTAESATARTPPPTNPPEPSASSVIPSPTATGVATASPEGRVESILESGRTAVRIRDANGSTLAIVNASVADDPGERFRGLSGATSLPNGTGMLFVFPNEGERVFVMREMAFPLDMVFVGADGRITAIHHAPTENDSDLTDYAGRAKWVLEVPYGWTTARGIDVGDAIEITYPDNASTSVG